MRSLPLTLVHLPGTGPEDVVVAPDGRVYTGTEDGSVLAVEGDGSDVRRVGRTGGRPLGLELLPDGRLLVCDAERGLLALDPATGAVETLVSHVRGERMVFCNNAAVHADGSIWFSDSSTRFALSRWKAEMVENTATGRLLRRDPDGTVEVVLEGLRFANGVALSGDASFVVVAETAGRALVRHWLTGPRAGDRDELAADLPGYPDNIARGSDGLLWVTIASPTDRLLERINAGPAPLRSLVWRVPERFQPKVRRTVRVLALDDDGDVVRDLAAEADGFHMVTGVREHEGRVWLGSLLGSAVAYADL